MPLAARKGLDQHLVAARQHRTLGLQLSQSRTWSGSRRPVVRVGQHLAHALGEIGRERKLAAVIGRDLRLGRVAPA